MTSLCLLAAASVLAVFASNHRNPSGGIPPKPLTFQGTHGVGKGKTIVFLAGDEEYRSEEGLTQLAKILALRHGFRCVVLFSVNDAGEIDPNCQTNQPGIEALDTADLCVMLLRFRHWPDNQMKHFVDYYRVGKPIIALRTSTHAFDYSSEPSSPFARFGWRSAEWPGGFGKQALGENWVSHWGNHAHEATIGVLAKISHPILKGVGEIFGTTDVYEAAPPSDAEILVKGQVLSGMNPTDSPAARRKTTVGGHEQDVNDPMMPVAWVREPKNEDGMTNRIFVTTMGAATDLIHPHLRRMILNGVLWSLHLERKITAKLNVDLVGDYQPTNFGFNGFRKGVHPKDLTGN